MHVLHWLVNLGYKVSNDRHGGPVQGMLAYISRLASKGAHVTGGNQELVPQYLDRQEYPLGDVWGAWLLQCGHVVP